MTTKGKSNVFLIEPDEAVRRPLARLIAVEPDLSVCGEASDIEEAIQAIPAAAPDVVVINADAFEGKLLSAVNRLRWVNPDVPLIAISLWEQVVRGRRMLQAGVAGYVSKSQAAVQIVPALRRVVTGGVYPRRWNSVKQGEKA